MKDIHNYDDIINLPHHTSPYRAKIRLCDRAAQFAPFEALDGHEDLIEETGRRTDFKVELSETVIEELNRKIQFIEGTINKDTQYKITYFVEDIYKKGGAYVIKKGAVKKIDFINKVIVMMDKTKIPVNDIIEIESEIFEKMSGDKNE